jgi:Spy/CpxP family protein refolding chaperone
MNTFRFKTLTASLLVALLATAATAAPGPKPEYRGIEEKLATAPGLTDTQRESIVRIEKEGREAQHALMEKTRSEHQALRDETTRKLRSALGDKAYADYLTWRIEQRAEHRGGRRGEGHGERGHGRRGNRPPPPDADQAMEPASEE